MSSPQDPREEPTVAPPADADPPTEVVPESPPGSDGLAGDLAGPVPVAGEPESAGPEEPHDADPPTGPAAESAEPAAAAAEVETEVAEPADADPPTDPVTAGSEPSTGTVAEPVTVSPAGEPGTVGPEQLRDADPPTESVAGEPPIEAGAIADPLPPGPAGEPESAGPEQLHDADPPTEPAADDTGGEEVESDELPQLSDEDLDKALEALLLVVDSPVEEDVLATALGADLGRVTDALTRMSAGLAEHERGFDLRRAGGGWRYYTRDKYAPYVEKMLLDGQRAKLTRAALETLAVIAYRQPVTRARVAAVRGVNCDGVIRTLLARGLVEETGTDVETGGYLYRTTELFLERLGLSSLEDLPPIAPLLPEVDAIDDV